MPFKSYLRQAIDRVHKVSPIETNTEVLTGAYGGVPPRISPTNIGNVFTTIPGHGMSGVSSPIAARPSSAPMLKSSQYHTQIPGVGRLLGLDTVSFKRGTDNVHPAAVSDVEHVSGQAGIHPSVARKVRRGDGSV